MKRLLGLTIVMTAISLPWTSSAVGKSKTSGNPKPMQTRPSAAGGVTAMYARGLQLFEAGKFQDALLAFDQILKRYPAYEPNKKMLARTLYKLDRYPEAWTFFSKINPATLDPDAAYEFGVVSFNARQFDASLAAMRRVPDGHGLHDLACYYGGLAALKLKRYEESEGMFEQAQVLPDRLARSRGLYLKHVQQLRLLQEQTELTREREAEKVRITRTAGGPGLAGGEKTPIVAGPAGVGAAGAAAGPANQPPAAANAPYEHKGFMGINRIMSFKGEQRTQLSDKHGFSDSATDITIGAFKFQQGPLLPIGTSVDSGKGPASGRRSAFGLQILFGGEDRGITGKEQRMVVIEDDQDIVRQQQTDTIKSHKQFAYVGADPWLEFALADDLWLQTGINSYFEYPDFKRLGRSGTVKGMAGIGAKRGKTTWQLTGTAGAFLNSENKTTTETKDGTARLSQDLNEKTTIEVEAVIKDFRYKDQSLDGPDQSISLGTTLSYSFGSGITTSLFGAYEKQKNAFFYGMPTYDQLSADGDVMTGEIAITAKPASWITLGLVQTISKTTWSVHREEAKETFEKNVPDYLSLFRGFASINFPF